MLKLIYAERMFGKMSREICRFFSHKNSCDGQFLCDENKKKMRRKQQVCNPQKKRWKENKTHKNEEKKKIVK